MGAIVIAAYGYALLKLGTLATKKTTTKIIEYGYEQLCNERSEIELVGEYPFA